MQSVRPRLRHGIRGDRQLVQSGSARQITTSLVEVPLEARWAVAVYCLTFRKVLLKMRNLHMRITVPIASMRKQ